MKEKNNSAGFTYLELLIVIILIGIISSFILVKVDPIEKKKVARDNKRLSDISLIERAISEYLLDKGAYPDTENTLRRSNALVYPSVSLTDSNSSWIVANLIKYTSHMPIDPINENGYVYSYLHNTNSYELNARLEHLNAFEQNDGGDDQDVYEVGNNLRLITP